MNAGKKYFMVSCLKATELIEKRGINGLSISETLRLHLHTALCTSCTRYERQSAFIDRWIAGRYGVPVPPERVDRLIETLTDKLRR